jgi:nitroreductase
MTEPFVNSRQPDHPIDKVFTDRWSPRAFTGEEIPVETLMGFFEAARWAPSSYNSQPWRFIYARRNTPHWDVLFDLLGEFNKTWAKDAAALVVLISKSTMVPPGQSEPIPSHSHSMDAGAAWENLSIQATLSGWHTHGMVGFDIERTREVLKVPSEYRVEQAFAIGKRGDKSRLSEMLQGRETPSPRKPLAETVFEGSFPDI